MKTNYIILIKKDGEVKRVKVKQNFSTKATFDSSEVCFENIEGYNPESVKAKELNTIKIAINGAIRELYKTDDVAINVAKGDKKNSVEELMALLKGASSKQDLIDIVIYTIEKCNSELGRDEGDRKIAMYYRMYPTTVIATLTKVIISVNFINKFRGLNNAQRQELCDSNGTDVSMLELMKKLDSYWPESSFKNGVCQLSQKAFNDLLNKLYDSEQVHLCFDCSNASAAPGGCQRIIDRKMKGIDDYDFVRSGLQRMSLDGETEEFLVTDCANFKKDEPRDNSTRNTGRAKSALASLYAGGETPADSRTIIAEARAREQRVKARNLTKKK